jgi:hypothetical protein
MEKQLTIINLDILSKFNVNIYEVENAILDGKPFLKIHDYVFSFAFCPFDDLRGYAPQKNELILMSKEGMTVIVKKI